MKKSCVIIPMDGEKAFDKIQHLSLIKKFHELRLEGNASKLRKGFYKPNQTKQESKQASKQATNQPTKQNPNITLKDVVVCP